ncbi:MAG TPA: helix-turn-helix domain-containing protein [Puia sp.]|nr:helix-turn-helix domain-containing protein [Puia sp.]
MVQLGILLTRKYRLLSVAAILDVFETVNRFYTEEGLEPPFCIKVLCSAGMKQAGMADFAGYQPQSIQDQPKQDLIFIPAFVTDDIKETISANQEYIPWLKQQHLAGAEIASYCTGAFLLGATGLLDGRMATTHIDACPAFASVFPAVRLEPDRIVTGESGLYTSGGATSGFHLMLHLIEQRCGKEMAVRTAKIFAIDMDRGQQTYFATFLPKHNHHDELVAMAQQKIAAAYQEAETIEVMIRDVPASRRNIVRRFKQVIGITPIEYLQKTRVEAAKKLLEQTNQQMTEVMLNSGYNDPKAFRKVFRKTVGMTPTCYREKFHGAYQAGKRASPLACLVLIVLSVISACCPQSVYAQFKPDDQALYDTILHQDSLFFGAYNTCSVHLQEYAAFYADNLEFYHDKGGLSTSKQDVVEATKKNICGKVTRELVPGSVEVYPIANFGAIEIGFHKFHNSAEPNAPSRAGRFVFVWHHVDNNWKITRVISLH